MSLRARDRSAGRGIAIAILIATSLAMFGEGNASAAEPTEERVFDPVLSLTGDCSSSPVDPVPDPGCPEGGHPLSGSFTLPRSIGTDDYGDIYVASYGNETGGSSDGLAGRIDIFDSSGNYLTELEDPSGPKNLAVDSKGNLYVFQERPGLFNKVEVYEPTGNYNPAAGEIEYGDAPKLVVNTLSFVCGLAINRKNDHLFVHLGSRVQEFSSAETGNEPLEVLGASTFNSSQVPQGRGLAVDVEHELIYASDQRSTAPNDFLIDVFELAAPHGLVRRIDGAETAAGKFSAETAIAVDEGSGDVFAYPPGKIAFQLSQGGAILDEIEHSIKEVFAAEIGVDNGGLSPNGGYLFVPSNPTGIGHSFAFAPKPKECPSEVASISFANVTEGEAELNGAIEPCGLTTSYSFEVTTLQRYEVEAFTGAQVVKQGQISGEFAPKPVAALLGGLTGGTTYRFRLVATNELGGDTAEAEFATYPQAEPREPCENDAFRTGFSSLLPDCRAYELVTPPETNARAPRGVGFLGPYFATREASPAGDRLSFITEGGTLPGSEGSGSLGGDPYLSKRDADGWSTEPSGPTGGEAAALLPGGVSPDQGYSFWNTGGAEGSASIEGKDTSYIRYPDGHSELVGRGSIGTDPRAIGRLITESGSHIIFISGSITSSPVQLEPEAPPSGTQAVYDRTADEVTHVVSLLPGNLTPEAGEDAEYIGASIDGRGIAFEIDNTLYLRYSNAETFEIGEGLTFAGITEGGSKIFYVEAGKLLRFNALNEEVTEFSTTGTVAPVNIAADGSTAYFVSATVLATEANPNGAEAEAGQQNLYLSREGAISFVGTVTEEDMVGEATGIGLGRWSPHVVSYGEAAEDPSRSTPNGGVLLFESRADLAGYDSNGKTEVYRYAADAGELTCLSCNPTKAPTTGGATLQSMALSIGEPPPLSTFGSITNLRPDGRRAFFQSTEPLVPTDTDGLQDVYEWEAQGVGSCTRAAGCIYLISSGQSSRINYLYAVSDSGDDVFFRSSDLLVPADLEQTASIYDVRVDGGFPEESSPGCEAEGCRPVLPAPPPMAAPESGVHAQSAEGKTCPKGKRKMRRSGKVRCVKKKHPRKHNRHQAGSKQKGAGK